MRPDPRIYAIADRDALGHDRWESAIGEMVGAGVGRIQIRAKGAAGRDVLELLRRCAEHCGRGSVELWVDDRVDVAALVPGIGVHLGQNDLEPGEAREILGPAHRVGRSTHDMEQVAAADRDPAVDLVAFGPVFPTRSKANPDPVVGLDGLRRAREATGKPLIAIGGIGESNLAAVLATGVDGAAMIAAVTGPDVGERCRRLAAIAEEVR